MNRRQVLKALATLPVASALGNCSSEQKQPPPPPPPPKLHTVEIHLDGAFAVVIQKHKANSILAFSPRDPHVSHRFYLETPLKELNPRKNYHFKLPTEGLEISERPEVKAGFEDFFAETKSFRLPDSLVALELPCPQSITFSGHREPAVFASGKHAWMPINHILKYHRKDAGGTKLLCSELGGECEPSPDSPPGLTRYFFEVGPTKGADPKGKHAVDFFNFMLKAAFPELEDRYRLTSIGLGERGKPGYSSSNIAPAVLTSDGPQLQLLTASYTLDCRSGGLLVGTNSGP